MSLSRVGVGLGLGRAGHGVQDPAGGEVPAADEVGQDVWPAGRR